MRRVGTDVEIAEIARARQGEYLGFRFAGAIAEALDRPIHEIVPGLAWMPGVAIFLDGVTIAIRDLQRRLADLGR